jgi:hypothetical protein
MVALAILWGWLAPPPRAQADSLPLRVTVSLGLPPIDVQVQVEASEADTLVRASAGRHTVEATIAGRTTEATVERLVLSGGGAVGIVRAQGGGVQVAALVLVRRGRPSIAWTGRLDPRGDPGERSADVLEVADRTGDGQPDVVVAQVREGLGLCGPTPALLFPRALDPASGEMRPVVLRRVGDGEEVGVTASFESPGPNGPPRLRTLRMVGASSIAGMAEDARALEPPLALTDGDPATYWAEGRGGAGEGEFVLARTGIHLPIRALAVTAPPAVPGLRAPRTLLLVGDHGPRLRVTLPEGPPPGARLWIVPPSPMRWGCVALVLADRGGEAVARTALAELELYTELDFERGIEGLIDVLVREDDEGDRATELLGQLGEPALRALDAAWERLGRRGRERAVRVAIAQLRSAEEPAVAVLVRGASDERTEVRVAAIAGLARAGELGRVRLVALARRPGAPGEDAAAVLARSEAPFPIGPLLAALSEEGGSERPMLRAAVGRGAALAPEAARGELERWAAGAPVAARAAAALGLARTPQAAPLARWLIEETFDEAETFPDRWRLVTATAALDEPGEAIEAWLANVAEAAEEWMLRKAALEGVARRRPEVARRSLDDPYPRVRAAAFQSLARNEEDRMLVAEAARRDPWPLVRLAALDALAETAVGRDRLRAAIGDVAPSVRRRAIELLTRLGDRTAWPDVEARLRDPDEWPSVLEAAVGYVDALCVEDAGESLQAVIRRGARQGAWEPDVEVAVRALRVALRLPGTTATEARILASRGGTALRAALERAEREPPAPCMTAGR